MTADHGLQELNIKSAIFDPFRSRPILGAFLALTAFGLNWFAIPVGFGVHLLLGSIATMIAAIMLGPLWALTVALSASIPTLTIWGHGYALIIFMLEALWVSIAVSRCNQRSYWADALFWGMVGAPLVSIFYGIFLQMDWDSVYLIIIKQSFNGFMNCSAAALIVRVAFLLRKGNHSELPDSLDNQKKTHATFNVADQVTEGIVTTSLVALLIILYLTLAGYTEERVYQQVESRSNDLTNSAALQLEAVLNRLNQPLTVSSLPGLLKEMAIANPELSRNILVKLEGHDWIGAQPGFISRSVKSKLNDIPAGYLLEVDLGGTNGIAMSKALEKAVVRKTELEIAGYQLEMAIVLELAPKVQLAREQTARLMTGAFALTGGIAIMSFLIGRVYARPIRDVALRATLLGRNAEDAASHSRRYRRPLEHDAVDDALTVIVKTMNSAASERDEVMRLLRVTCQAAPCAFFVEDFPPVVDQQFGGPVFWAGGLHRGCQPEFDTEPAPESVLALFSGKEEQVLRTAITESAGRGETIELDLLGQLPNMEEDTWLRLFMAANPLANGTVRVTGLIMSVQNEYSLQQELRHLTYFDPVTGCGNYHNLRRELPGLAAEASAQGHCLVMYVFHMTNYQDPYFMSGPEAGDISLRLLTEKLAKDEQYIFRPNLHQLVVVDCMNLDRISIEQRALVMTNSLEQPIDHSGMRYRIRVHCGVSFQDFPPGGAPAEACYHSPESQNFDIAYGQFSKTGFNQNKLDRMLINGEIAVQRALDEDKRVVIHDPDMETVDWNLRRVRQDMHQALGREQFFLVYQPQVDLKTGEVKGFEALLRWHHPEFGVISPATFIPMAEKDDLIYDIGLWVVERALNGMQRSGIPEYQNVSVNVSMRQLASADFAADLFRVVNKYQFAAKRLELEITESSAVFEHSVCRQNLEALRKMGHPIAIDDFGTGYSSLERIKSLPFDTIKIDKVFADDIVRDQFADEILDLLVQVGRVFYARIIVEGVETMDQLRVLNRFESLLIQGFVFSKPVQSDILAHTSRRLFPVPIAS